MKAYEGIVHGQTIELTEAHGLIEGSRVSVILQPTVPVLQQWGEGLRRCAGILADSWTEEDDRILEEIAQSRHTGRNRDLDLDHDE